MTEFSDLGALRSAATQAAERFGFTRMWSIHPAQIQPILQAFAPAPEAVQTAARILFAAAQADWAPIDFDGVLHDRASYRYYWKTLQRARMSGIPIGADAEQAFFS